MKNKRNDFSKNFPQEIFCFPQRDKILWCDGQVNNLSLKHISKMENLYRNLWHVDGSKGFP